ncbi:MAG TPA: Mu transposase C-terminal domain-containing protein, partial [Thermoanaerobaculia bacterium]|nr:Mu transposase C-terminal domain-containing protein [Thermoanaerobaculia bacterium]
KKVAIVHNLTMPSLAIFRRYEETIPVAVKKLFRDPDSKHSNLRPYIERDYSGLHAMQIIQSDHHQIDVAVRCGDPLCEAGHYPWITVWMDVRSRKVLAVEVYVEYPNSKRILKLLHRVLLENGPCEFVYADNGMDYVKSVGAWGIKHFDVGRRGAKLVEVVGFTPEILERICGPFGIQAIFSNEGNPQSKAIERWFETLKGRLYSDYDSYRGALGERSERAEWLRTHPAELPALQDLALNLQLAIEEYNDAPHRGDGMESRSPNVVFEATRLPVRELDRAALAQAFWDEKIGAKVQRLGIKHNHRWYALDAKVQATYFGRKVRIRYHDEDPEQIVVCDAGGAFIGIGRVRTKAPQFRGPEVAKANADLASEWKAIKAHLRAHNPDAAKRLAASGADIDAYRQLKARSSEATAPIAVAGGGSVVTVVDGHLSSLGRLIARAERDLENPAGLTPEELELARAIVPPTNEELEQLVRFAPLQAVPDETDEDASVNTELAAAGLRRLARERSEAGMCVYDLDCPNLGDFDEGMCVNHFNRVFGG